MSSYQSAEKPLGCAGVMPVLEKKVNDIAILVDGAPEVVLFTSDLDEDFIVKDCVSIAWVLTAQALGNLKPKLDAPEADRFTADGNTPRSAQYDFGRSRTFSAR